jgi:hypothetical protein
MRMRQVLWVPKRLCGILETMARKTADMRRDQSGVSAIEFAFVSGLLVLGLLNTIDVSIYLYQRMELENATQMGVQAVWKACDPNDGHLPATTSCPGLTTAITKAVQSTSLGGRVSLGSGSPAEGYYCLNSSGALQYVSDVSNEPADCSAAGMPSLQPSDYIQISTTFDYAPLFRVVSVAGAFQTPITKTAMMRLN